MRSVLLLVFCSLSFLGFSQIGPYTWYDHLSINSCNSVTKCGTTIYASYRNGLIKFDQSEWSPKTVNKINGLSDIGIRWLRTNSYNNKLLVIYDNCNIDVIDQNGNIVNYPDFKLKSFSGKKIINEVSFDKQYAYLACGFGIVVFDMEKLEVKDTYLIGANASQLEVYQIALNDSLIFAATPIGVYRSNYKTRILNNYKNWKLDTINLPKGPYSGIVKVDGKLLAAYAPSKRSDTITGKDTLYLLNPANVWIKYPPMANAGSTIKRMEATYKDLFSTSNVTGLSVFNVNTGQLATIINNFNGQVGYGTHRDSYIGLDHTNNISYWLADWQFGLFQTYGFYFPQNKITRNGTNANTISNIDVFNGKVAVSPSFVDNAGQGNYSTEGLNYYVNKNWSYLPCKDENGKAIVDVTSVLIDRKDTSVTWSASWYLGVMKYKNNKPVKVYSPSTTTMATINGEPRCSGLSTDKDGNIWVTNSDQKNFLSVIKKNGNFQNFGFDAGRFARKTFVDKNNNVWILHERGGGVTVFKPGNFSNPVMFVDNAKAFNARLLLNEVGSGNLQDNAVYAIAEDKDGKIWIGTAQGISVFYNPSAIFSSSDFDSQPIKIVQDGNVELLLSKEAVTSIVVDGANNKWIGTSQGGVYCFSPDGLKQIYHFTKENSPLYSNGIIDMAYDESTGDVFIGTDIGLQSFRGTIVAGEEQYSNVYAYPNPVKPNYQGSVFVRGLMDNSVVKITDESGNLVWETKSNGGQIEWPVTTLSGNRVTTGVYIVYASTTTGEFKALTKVLVVN